MSDERQFKEFVFNAKQMAAEVMSTDHVSAEVVTNTKDLVQIITAFEAKLDDSTGQSGDMRILKGRYEKLKRDSADALKEVERVKTKVIPVIISELRSITSSTNVIVRENAKTPESESSKAAVIIQGSIKKIIAAFN